MAKQKKTCDCGGSGKVNCYMCREMPTDRPDPNCNYCYGKGKYNCPVCDGKGYVYISK